MNKVTKQLIMKDNPEMTRGTKPPSWMEHSGPFPDRNLLEAYEALKPKVSEHDFGTMIFYGTSGDISNYRIGIDPYKEKE